ncbi:peptidoglycan D,D-transpeptidase FtsI family protein [Anaerotignum sp. MB30-C6]|uniref:peptidoglycan D,D-transpeptidase FtsI family protein n=1 Tax=Anaerotignum sp. MB30-C6 TaxID=3070814 RepID=UPI0027DE3448|nr:penicillin-binding transpeptidase domain-containing protein [Anaerotignum sp. MB30-C6]WMI80241.1 penicillin-binding transpeptidase domain-containing protein [Anaerotignum sp. MB30-C6]
MNNMKRSIRRIFWLLALCFFLLLGYLGKLVLVERQGVSTNAYNSRLRYVDNSLRRGDIIDIDGEILATSVLQDDGTYMRKYPRARMAAHITGYSSVGKTGVEAAENFEVMTLHNEFFQRIMGIATKKELVGNSVVVTVDMDIQSIAGDLLGNAKGAVVVMEPSTGRILALQAYPDFDPNQVAAHWDQLKDHEDSPLVNRGTQGVYPPGSTFKLVTALSIMENMKDWQTRTYECTGEAAFQDKVIHCYKNKAHGTVDMKQALTVSCNCYFAQMAKEIGPGKLREVMARVGMESPAKFELAYSQSKIGLEASATESELVETAIGQGRTAVTPLYMAMFVSAIANEGIMMQPYIVDHIQYSNGKVGKQTVPKKLTEVCSTQESAILRDMMVSVVDNGTGTAAAISGVSVAGKTGTAENATGNDHSWFIGYAPAEDPKVAVAVVIENSRAYGSATPVAGKVIREALAQLESK